MLIARFAGWRTIVSVQTIVVAVLIAADWGCSSAFIPLQAAQQNPIAALRYE